MAAQVTTFVHSRLGFSSTWTALRRRRIRARYLVGFVHTIGRTTERPHLVQLRLVVGRRAQTHSISSADNTYSSFDGVINRNRSPRAVNAATPQTNESSVSVPYSAAQAAVTPISSLSAGIRPGRLWRVTDRVMCTAPPVIARQRLNQTICCRALWPHRLNTGP
jgi:hypothetical protein